MFKRLLSFTLIFILAFTAIAYSEDTTTPDIPKAAVIRMSPYEIVHTGLSKEIIIIEDYVADGSIGVSASSFGDAKLKLIISKDGQNYTYDLTSNGVPEFFPLQLGNGVYNLSILENTTGSSYKYVRKTSVEATIENEFNVYLQPMQYNDWTDNVEFMSFVDELTIDATTNQEIIQVLYDYMITNFGYDYNKATTVKSGYQPDISLLLNGKIGICYDYAAVYSAALRYKGIPAKLVKGYTTYVNSYHAWNEVLTDEGWVTVDLTIDAFFNTHNMTFSFAKDDTAYTTKYQY
ncbi:MAG: Putative Transglutaminase-like enzyme, cysteine protease [Clostridiales bacterium 38_11]|nr:MAG: Putative Transglutaminase-like enzyme, cysteine protease [Clostridiales bacterium 38_11]HBH12282.1 transglutaminase [Clostridiales bacterium]